MIPHALFLSGLVAIAALRRLSPPRAEEPAHTSSSQPSLGGMPADTDFETQIPAEAVIMDGTTRLFRTSRLFQG